MKLINTMLVGVFAFSMLFAQPPTGGQQPPPGGQGGPPAGGPPQGGPPPGGAQMAHQVALQVDLQAQVAQVEIWITNLLLNIL